MRRLVRKKTVFRDLSLGECDYTIAAELCHLAAYLRRNLRAARASSVVDKIVKGIAALIET